MNAKARCKVVWVVDAGGLKKTQIGVELVADQDCPWVAALPPGIKSKSARRCVRTIGEISRHRISFPLEMRDERVNTPLRVNATDISGNGCYVETVMPLPIGPRFASIYGSRRNAFPQRCGSHSRPRRRHGH